MPKNNEMLIKTTEETISARKQGSGVVVFNKDAGLLDPSKSIESNGTQFVIGTEWPDIKNEKPFYTLEEYYKDDQAWGIDAQENLSVYNKDFNPSNPHNFGDWLQLRPSHLSKEDWMFQLGKLNLMLGSKSMNTDHDRDMLILGWKSHNGLLLKQ